MLCNEIDTGGALIEMTLPGARRDGKRVAMELMVPSSMVRMIVSAHSDELFGFGPHAFGKPAPMRCRRSVRQRQPADAPPEALPRRCESPLRMLQPPAMRRRSRKPDLVVERFGNLVVTD